MVKKTEAGAGTELDETGLNHNEFDIAENNHLTKNKKHDIILLIIKGGIAL